MPRATDETLGDVHGHFADYLDAIVQGRKVAVVLTASQMKEIREFLRDNHIDSVPAKGSSHAGLAKKIAAAVAADEDGKVVPMNG